MRTCLGEAARMVADDLSVQDLKGVKWLLLSGYCFYGKNLLQRAIELAAEANVKVALDLASFEVVQTFKQDLKDVLESGRIHCCFCNEVPDNTSLLPHCMLQLHTFAHTSEKRQERATLAGHHKESLYM